jgi:hypothetical protein
MSTRNLRRTVAALTVLLATACAQRAVPPPAPLAPPPTPPPPAPAPPPPPPAVAWEDVPISFGDWVYRDEGGASSATFGSPGQPQLVLRCEPGRVISLRRIGAAAGSSLTVRTSFGDRAASAASIAASPPALTASFGASDPLLDSLVFSRGRFAVEAASMPMLIVPAWPEPARVIEDCRG